LELSDVAANLFDDQGWRHSGDDGMGGPMLTFSSDSTTSRPPTWRSCPAGHGNYRRSLWATIARSL
jgi:hypothetical protein